MGLTRISPEINKCSVFTTVFLRLLLIIRDQILLTTCKQSKYCDYAECTTSKFANRKTASSVLERNLEILATLIYQI